MANWLGSAPGPVAAKAADGPGKALVGKMLVSDATLGTAMTSQQDDNGQQTASGGPPVGSIFSLFFKAINRRGDAIPGTACWVSARTAGDALKSQPAPAADAPAALRSPLRHL
jgi:hypothetical protein